MSFLTSKSLIMRNPNFNLLAVTALLLLFLIPGQKLVSQNSAGGYYVIQYHKVHPTMESEYYELETSVWKKIHNARISEDLCDGWYLFRVISPNGTKTEYNYVLVLEYDNEAKLAGHFESFGVDSTQLLSPEEISTALRTPTIRDQVYEEVWLNLDTEMKNGDGMYKFQVFNAMKLKPGISAQEYQRIENNYWRPMHRLRINTGKMHGWGIYNMIIPGGTERAYQWATVDFYDNFIDYMTGTDNEFAKIHGSRNAQKYLEETLSKRDLLRTEVRELLDFISDNKAGE